MILKTSGTTGNPKEISYSEEDFNKVSQSLKRFFEIWKTEGTVYNLFKAGANLSFVAGNDYAKSYGGKTVTIEDVRVGSSMKECPVFSDDISKLSEKSFDEKPEITIGLPKTTIDFLRKADVSKISLVICNKGITDEQILEIKELCPKAEIASAYGFTEAKAAWVTCRDFSQGHHVFEESGTFSKENGELVYNGYRTGDSGDIIDGKCPSCGFGMQRVLNIKRI